MIEFLKIGGYEEKFFERIEEFLDLYAGMERLVSWGLRQKVIPESQRNDVSGKQQEKMSFLKFNHCRLKKS